VKTIKHLADEMEREIAPVDRGAAEGERNDMVEFVLVPAFDGFADGGQHFGLDPLHPRDVGSHCPRPDRRADRLRDRRLSDRWVQGRPYLLGGNGRNLPEDEIGPAINENLIRVGL
jgi:hypothetical protein